MTFEAPRPSTSPGGARKIEPRRYTAADDAAWDALVAASLGGTFLHTRKFLSYHGDRFDDRSVILARDGRVVAVLPAAVDRGDSSRVVSHPGLTYGGLIYDDLRGSAVREAIAAAAALWRAEGFSRLVYKAVPAFYHRAPAADDRWALANLGASLSRVDLSATVDLTRPLALNDNRQRGRKKAVKAGIIVDENPRHLAGLWPVLAANLAERHAVKPVHSLDEIQLLSSWFPSNIRTLAALDGETLVAGVVLFASKPTLHAQYIATSPRGQETSALDAVFARAFEIGAQEGFRWFDFGVSTEDGGRVLNDGLHRFKCSFGGGGWPHEFYDLAL